MATLNAENLTLLDQVKRRDPNGAIARIVETMTKRNPLLEDMTWVEGNLPTGHRFTSRTALPTVDFRMYNQGVAPSKSRTDQVDETCGMLEGNSKVDVELAELNGDAPAFRASEDMAFVQAMNNKAEYSIFYSSSLTSPQAPMGLSPRFNALTGGAASSQTLSFGAAAGNDSSSVWMISWSPETVFGIYPKGSVVGLKPTDMGKQAVDDGTGAEFIAYRTFWNWKFGLCVKDARYVVRICNIDDDVLVGTNTALIDKMIEGYHQIQDHTTGRLAIYCNRRIAAYLHLQAKNAIANSTLSIDAVGGKPVTHFLGAPVRVSDALATSEAPVT